MARVATELLNDDMLARFDERAPLYDRENRFFDEDFEELVASGYLRAPIPTEQGGSGALGGGEMPAGGGQCLSQAGNGAFALCRELAGDGVPAVGFSQVLLDAGVFGGDDGDCRSSQ